MKTLSGARAMAAIACLLILVTGSGAVRAASPSPANPSPSGAVLGPSEPSPPVIDPLAACQAYAALLPSSVALGSTEHGLSYEWRVGPVELAPGYPVAGLVEALGLDEGDVCLISFSYGLPFTGGTLVRFAGADPAALLDAYVADAMAVSQDAGQQVEVEAVDVGGRPSARLTYAGLDGAVYDTQVADVIVEVVAPNEGSTFQEILFARLPAPGAPLPELVAPPGGSAAGDMPGTPAGTPLATRDCLDAHAMDLLSGTPQLWMLPAEQLAAVVEALQAYDPKGDLKSRDYRKLMKAKEKLIASLLARDPGARAADDAAALLTRYRVRECS